MTASELVVLLEAQIDIGRGAVPLWVEATCPACFSRRGFRLGEIITLNSRGDRLVIETVKEATNGNR